MDTKEKKPGYIICSKTLKELKNETEGMGSYDRVPLYVYEIDRSDMSDEQKEKQLRNGWYRNQDFELRTRDEQLYKIAKKKIQDKIFNGYDGVIDKEVFNEIYNSNVNAVASIGRYGKDNYSRLSVDVELDGISEYNDSVDNYDYTDNTEEFQEKLKDVKNKNSFSSDDDFILLEKLTIYVYPRTYEDIEKRIERQIKKVIREDFTYCLKNGKCIVPEEYLKKGDEGIKTWREMKANGNKNNSMEKRMLRQIVKDKKIYANDCMSQIMNKIASTRANWSIPSLEVEGRYNATKTAKLVSKMFDNRKDMQYYINLTENEIAEKFKKYWKETLLEAYKAVDEMLIVKRS